MIEIVNSWRTTDKNLPKFYKVEEKDRLAEIGDYAAYKLPSSVLYTYKNVSINELVKFNKEYFEALVNNKRPIDTSRFLFDRALERRDIILNLLK